MAHAAGTASDGAGRTTKESIQDTIISVVIAFALAFVFRGFVVEAFVIPTGSMAPTLMGAHERVRSEKTGYTWAVGPWEANPAHSQNYLPRQGVRDPIRVHDPMSGELVQRSNTPLLSGDRILVLKYLYTVMEPERFDVVVFKFKETAKPEVNYIKRLTGLPGEELAIVDGDIFSRDRTGRPQVDRRALGNGTNQWAEAGWKVARKPAHVQRAMWQRVFDSDYAPRAAVTTGNVRTTPWRSDDAGWTIGGRVYEHAGAVPTELYWDGSLLRFDDATGKESWQIDDRYPYNEIPLPPGYPRTRYPVSDLRMGVGIEPGSEGLTAKATIGARGHEFQMEVAGDAAVLRMRPATAGAAWREVGRATIRGLTPGRVTNVEFWHVDQTLEAWIEGKRVCRFEYDWSPSERMEYATGTSVSEWLAAEPANQPYTFSKEEIYKPASVKWSFEGAPVKLHRVSLDRDIFYQPGSPMGGAPARGARPEAPMVLNEDQFFVCGDNSPQSQDARLWDPPEPFVRLIDPTEGVVPRKQMLGKAFFVYFPALHEEASLPVPDFGRMRFIW